MDYKLLGMRIRELRKDAGITQEELGKRINKRMATITRYELALIEPSLPVLEDIAKALNVNLGEVLGLGTDYSKKGIEMLEKYNKLNDKSKYLVDSIIEMELQKTKRYQNKMEQENNKLTEDQQEELEEIKQAMIKENEAKNLKSMEKKKIEKNIG